LAHSVGNATGYLRTGLLFVEPTCATLAVVDSADGSISDICRQPLADHDGEAVTHMVGMVADAVALESQPNGLFVVGSDGVDIAAIKPHLQAVTPLHVSTAEERQLALAKGAALASAHAPLLASSTAALGYARDPGTGEVRPGGNLLIDDATTRDLVEPGGLAVDRALAYAAVDDGDDFTVAAGDGADGYFGYPEAIQSRKPFLTAMGVLTVFVVGVVALVLALAVSIRPHVRQRPLRPHPLPSLPFQHPHRRPPLRRSKRPRCPSFRCEDRPQRHRLDLGYRCLGPGRASQGQVCQGRVSRDPEFPFPAQPFRIFRYPTCPASRVFSRPASCGVRVLRVRQAAGPGRPGVGPGRVPTGPVPARPAGIRA
jgi:hypothetical protein